jgi:hypothetical protein
MGNNYILRIIGPFTVILNHYRNNGMPVSTTCSRLHLLELKVYLLYFSVTSASKIYKLCPAFVGLKQKEGINYLKSHSRE